MESSNANTVAEGSPKTISFKLQMNCVCGNEAQSHNARTSKIHETEDSWKDDGPAEPELTSELLLNRLAQPSDGYRQKEDHAPSDAA